MSFQPIKTGLKYFSAWSLVAGFVALLTIIFSFLGTLFCSALGGMMMGATKASLKISLPFSVLCPGILLSILRSQKSELADRQIIILLVICLVAFWTIYAVSAALMAHEQKGISSKEVPKTDVKAHLSGAASGLKNVSAALHEPRATAAATAASLCFQLKELEGHWCCEACSLNGQMQKRVLEIKGGALMLSTLDAEGRVCACTRVRLRCTEASEVGVLAFSAGGGGAEFLLAGHQI